MNEKGATLEVDLFHGPVTTTESVLYAQVALPSNAPKSSVWQLRGQLKGPINQRAETLPVTLEFADAGPGETGLARVRVPDPCSWSMDLPSLYQVDLELLCDGKEKERWQGVTGFRDFGAAGLSFSLNGERWVVRGKVLKKGKPLVADEWQTGRLACVCNAPSSTDLELASASGIYLIVQLPANDWQAELQRVAAWPAVWAAILPEVPQQPLQIENRSNVAIGCVTARDELVAIDDGTRLGLDFVCLDAEAIETEAALSPRLPMIATDRNLNAAAARTACDQLQTRLAPGNFAGYIVGW